MKQRGRKSAAELSIIGAGGIAVARRLDPPSLLSDEMAKVWRGIVNGKPTLDLDYEQDFAAAVDMNVVMTGGRRFVEIQGTGEEDTFSDDDLDALLKLARRGIKDLAANGRKPHAPYALVTKDFIESTFTLHLQFPKLGTQEAEREHHDSEDHPDHQGVGVAFLPHPHCHP